MPDAILLQEERQTAKWRQHCVEPWSSRRRNCSQFPARRQLVDTACSQAKASPSSPPASHLIIVILLVMLCGSCQAAWLASCQQFSCCLFAFTHGAEAGRGKQRSRARLCVCCWSGARGVCVLFSLSAAAAASVRGLTAPTVALRLPP